MVLFRFLYCFSYCVFVPLFGASLAKISLISPTQPLVFAIHRKNKALDQELRSLPTEYRQQNNQNNITMITAEADEVEKS